MSEIDLQQVLKEIDAEVRARRASGDFPPDLERELDLAFARFSPASASGNDLDALLQAAEKASFMDADPPTGSRMPAVGALKKTERKLLGWYFRYVTQQTTAFGGVVIALLRLLGRRVERLEVVTGAGSDDVLAAARKATGAAVDVSGHVAGAGGRVLVAEATDPSLVTALEQAGADVYAIGVGEEVVLDHLQVVDDGALGGLVLAGAVDRGPLGMQLAILDRALAVLAPGGRLAIVGTDPAAWGQADPVLADLSPGRPLHAETWVHLLDQRGVAGAQIARSGTSYAVLAER